MKVYSASREGHLPEVISYVNKFTLTPLPGLLFNGLLGIIFVLLNDINALLNMYMVAASFFYGLCMLSLVVMRWTRREVHREFKVWIVVPVLIMLFFWYCSIAPLTELVDENKCDGNQTACQPQYSLNPENVDMVRPRHWTPPYLCFAVQVERNMSPARTCPLPPPVCLESLLVQNTHDQE